MDLEFLKKRLSVYEWFWESYNVNDSSEEYMSFSVIINNFKPFYIDISIELENSVKGAAKHW